MEMSLTVFRAAGRTAPAVLLLLLASACAATHNPALPFTGTRSFNFEQGAGTEQLIRIDEKGHTLVTLAGGEASVTLYEGPYQNPLPIRGEDGKVSSYYRIDGSDSISALDADGRLQTGCHMSETHPCSSGLYPEE